MSEIYKIWQTALFYFPKTAKYTLGEKIYRLLIECLESVFLAGFSRRDEKLPYIRRGIVNADLTKFFLQISWEIKALDSGRFIALSEKLVEVGKMLNGWAKQVSAVK